MRSEFSESGNRLAGEAEVGIKQPLDAELALLMLLMIS